MHQRIGNSTRSRNRWFPDLAISILIAALPIFLYRVILAAGFVSDDYLWHAFFRNSIADLYEKVMQQHRGEIEFAYFRPTLIFSYQIDYRLWGDSAYAFHLVNVLLHAANCVLLYFLGRTIGFGRFAAMSAAIFWGVYPANAEAVNWMSGRGDVLSVSWIFVSLLLWSGARTRPSALLTVLSAIAFVFAIGAKESAAAAVLLLPLIDWLLNIRGQPHSARREEIGWGWKGYVLFAAIVAAAVGFRYWLFGDMGGQLGPGNTSTYFHLTWPQVWSTLVLHNLKMMFTPMSRVLWPDWPDFWHKTILITGIVWALFLAGGLFFSTVFARREKGTPAAILVGMLWIFIMMAPAVPLFPVLDSMIRTRYLYAPAIGLGLWAGAVTGMMWRGGTIWKGIAILCLAAMIAISGYSIGRYGEVWILSSVRAEGINSMMAENTRFLSDGATVFEINLPRHYRGVPCAPYRYGEYLEFLYGYKNVRTIHVRKDPADIPEWWGGLRQGWHTPAAAFLWDIPSKSCIMLPPIDQALIESRGSADPPEDGEWPF